MWEVKTATTLCRRQDTVVTVVDGLPPNDILGHRQFLAGLAAKPGLLKSQRLRAGSESIFAEGTSVHAAAPLRNAAVG